MRDKEKFFIELTRQAIAKEYRKLENGCVLDEKQWLDIEKLAINNKLGAVVFDAVKQQVSLPEDIRKGWDMYRFQVFIRQKGHEKVLWKLIDEMEATKIQYALFKGCVLADLYPNSAYRVSSDTDILVNPEQRLLVSQMILNRGYELVEHSTKNNVFVYLNEATGHIIELHTSLFEDYEGKKIDILKKADLGNPNSFISLDVCGRKISTLGINEHLLYQMFHIIKHFTLEGANIRFFTDIALYINKYGDRLSRDYYWTWAEKLNYHHFSENFFQICVDYFGMSSDFMDGRKGKASKEVLEAMIVDFVYQGDEKELRNGSWQLTATLEPYLVGERTTVKKSKGARTFSYLFPKAGELNENYAYAKKYPMLLPIAWGHRVMHKLRWQAKEQTTEYSAKEKVEIVESRLGLLGSVGLLEEE